MATESFGVSFGNPSKYIGSNPGIARAAQALKIGGSIYLMDKSGFTGFLDNLGIKQKNGEYTFDNSAPAAPPVAMAPVAVPPAPAVVPPAPINNPLNDPAFKPQSGFVMPQTSGYATPEVAPVPMPRITGEDLLDGKISVANPNDFNPAEGGGYTDILASGNEYQQQPGYGKNKKLLSSLFGIA